MYKLSYEKCVCFIFLVIVAILSCSGFRIDSLAMTDISKKNSYTSSYLLNHPTTPSSDFINRLFSQNIRYNREQETPQTAAAPRESSRYLTKRYPERRHRIRHFRQTKHHQQQQQLIEKQEQPATEAQFSNLSHEKRPTGRIDTLVIRPQAERTAAPTLHPSSSQKLAQIPPSPSQSQGRLLPTTAVVTRSQRSSDKNGNNNHNNNNKHQRNRNSPCQEQDAARKAYLANTVVLARAESMSSNRLHNYSVSFKILKRLKNSSSTSPVDDHVRLMFSSDSRALNCETEGHHQGQQRTRGLVKAKIQQSKDYFLFLNAYGAHNYSVYGMPVLYRKKFKKNIDEININRVINPHFELKTPKIANLTKNVTHDRKLKLVCKTKGFPIPYLSWRKDTTALQPTNRTRITYKSEHNHDRRKTTLVIKYLQERDFGHYECVAKGVDGTTVTKSVHIDRNSITTTTNRKECQSDFRENFCHNGGTCFFIRDIREYSCICADGYGGQHCEDKVVSNQSSESADETSSHRTV